VSSVAIAVIDSVAVRRKILASERAKTLFTLKFVFVFMRTTIRSEPERI
jgi:hypothetical protein